MPDNMETKVYRANAKLMITGEYLVLSGAPALALPLVFGQDLEVGLFPASNSILEWKTYIWNKPWFEVVFSTDEFVIGTTNDFPTAQNLRNILISARKLNPEFLKGKFRFLAVSKLDFDISWGLGSSSSLIANIASFAQTDPFELYDLVSTGSGYDLATAISLKPIVYRKTNGKRIIEPAHFYPGFHEQLYFAYSGKKMISSSAVESFLRDNTKDYKKEILEIQRITSEMLQVKTGNGFRKLMTEHEKLISGILEVPSIGETHYSDFQGAVKSLGAWGGDFIMVSSELPEEYVISWFKRQNISVWFRFSEIVRK